MPTPQTIIEVPSDVPLDDIPGIGNLPVVEGGNFSNTPPPPANTEDIGGESILNALQNRMQ